MSAPETVQQLVARFRDNQAAYKSPEFNETEVRTRFLNPLFEALGWDFQSHEVKLEDRVEVREGSRVRPKNPDYGFYTGKDRRFFVEAKKPAVNLKENRDPAFQVRRYGWSAKLPVCILTDFEEFIIYDCRIEPGRGDAPDKGRLRYYTFEDYVEKWDEIAGLFSREAVLANSLEAWIRGESIRGAQTVDEAFLKEMEGWRELLAKHIALHHGELTHRQLNMAVQATIDRLVFLRICEDRDIEPYGRLQDISKTKDIYEALKVHFRQADDKYNSGLFYFKPESGRGDPDKLTLDLHVDNDPLRQILSRLYYPDSPYEFSVLPADILGQVYERFLGKVIESDTAGGIKVEEKPAVRKAGGVYYTPTYIVDYIVQQTVGKLVENKTPDEVAGLRILDPACGSGSFLLGAYQYLLDWHVAYYSRKAPKKYEREKRLRELPGADSGYALTSEEKKRILLNNLYGVDLDQQAVEVTKLSLLLKMLEGETAATAQPALLSERVLPDLSGNIQWGNSLIGTDFYAGQQMALFGDEELYRVKAFDWGDEATGFGGILKAGGFDAVIGNPPYIRIQTMKETAPETVPYYSQMYTAAKKGNYDIYVVFIEKGLQLLNPDGRLGYIVPHKFFNAQYGEPLRGLIAQGKNLAQVVHFGDEQVFANATTYTCLLFLDKKAHDNFGFTQVNNLLAWYDRNESVSGDISSDTVTAKEWNFIAGKHAHLFMRLEKYPVKLADVANMFVGLQTSADTIYLFKDFKSSQDGYTEVYSKELKEWVKIETQLLKPVIRSGHIGRYNSEVTALLLFPYFVENNNAELMPRSHLKKFFPSGWSYLLQNQDKLAGREKGKFADNEFYRFGRNQNVGMWEQAKLLVPYMITELAAYYDMSDSLYFVNVTTGGYGVTINDSYSHALSHPYLCGLLNSKLLDFYLKQVSTNFQGGYFAANKQYIEQLPIRVIDFADAADKARHDKMVSLVERMLDLQRQVGDATGEARRILEGQIGQTDKAIDGLVYELYGLTDAEIGLVENV